jgi:hypothetical protein
MNRPVLIHGGLLCAALITAYFVWTREPSLSEDDITILSLREGALEKVIYTAEERTVEIERRKDERGTYNWLRVETMEAPPQPFTPPSGPGKAGPPAFAPPGGPGKAEPKTPAGKVEPKTPAGKAETKPPAGKAAPKAKTPDSLNQDPKADPKKAEPKKAEPKKAEPKKAEPKKAEPSRAIPAPPTPPAPPPAAPKLEPPKLLPKVRKVQEFVGNKTVEELMKGLSSLAAVRSLGKLEPDKLKAFGLEGSKKSLTLVSGSSPRVFIIGGNTFGNMDTYIQDKEDGRVYVIKPRLLQDFLYAEFRLMERSPHTFELTEVEKAVIAVKEGKRTILQQNRRDPGTAFWVDEGSPDKKKDFFRNWVSKVFRLRVQEYSQPSKRPENLMELFSISYFGGRKLGEIHFFKQGATAPRAPGAPGDAGEYYILTETTRIPVKISKPLGDEVARDVASLLKE